MKKNYYLTAPKSSMAHPLIIEKVIRAIEKLHSEDPKDGDDVEGTPCKQGQRESNRGHAHQHRNVLEIEPEELMRR